MFTNGCIIYSSIFSFSFFSFFLAFFLSSSVTIFPSFLPSFLLSFLPSFLPSYLFFLLPFYFPSFLLSLVQHFLPTRCRYFHPIFKIMMQSIHYRLQPTNHSTLPLCSICFVYHKISSQWEGMEKDGAGLYEHRREPSFSIKRQLFTFWKLLLLSRRGLFHGII